MSLIPTQAENPAGLHQRYVVTKANGEPCDPRAVYLVLRLDYDGDDLKWIQACREAALRLVYELDATDHLSLVAAGIADLLAKTRRPITEELAEK